MNITIQAARGVLVACLSCAAFAGSTNLVWRWSNPTPFGNNISDLAYHTNNPVVAVADSGQIFTSTDLSTWTSQESGTTKWLRAATYFGTPATDGSAPLLVVTGAEGTILTSTDSSFFDLQDLSTTDWLEGVVSSGSRLVAVGDNGAIYTSDTGTNWTRQSVTFNTWLRGVAYRSGGPFVAVGENGFVATSADGVSWTKQNSGVTAHLNRAGTFHIGGKDGVLVVGEGGVAIYSTDAAAKTWSTARTDVTADLYVATQETRFDFASPYGALIIAGDEVVRSGSIVGGNLRFSDETSSSHANPAPRGTYFAGLSTGGQLLLAGRAGYILPGARSSQFALTIDWTPPADSSRSLLFSVATNEAFGTNIMARLVNDAVVYSTNLTTDSFYAAVGDGPTILQSDSGRSWSTALVPAKAAGATLVGLGTGPGTLVAVGTGGVILRSQPAYAPLTSTNVFTNSAGHTVTVIVTNQINTFGLSWDSVTSPTTANLYAVANANGRWIAGGAGGTLLSSTDAAKWTSLAAVTAKTVLSVDASPQRWIATGEAGTILRSDDGSSWSVVNSPSTVSLSRVRWLGGRFVVVGENGTVLTSSDGANWSSGSSGVTNWLHDVIQIEGTYFASGGQGTLLASEDAGTWQRLEIITAKSLYGLASIDGQLISVGLDGAALRSHPGAYDAPVEIALWPHQSTDSLFLFTGEQDQLFRLERSTNQVAWSASGVWEIKDPSGTLLLIDPTPNNPGLQFFRTAPP